MENNAKEGEKNIPALGLLSTIFGALSMVPFLGIFSIAGLILGIISFIKKGKKWAIIGMTISALGIATSPSIWAIVICSVSPESCEQTLQGNSESAEFKINKFE